MNREMLLERFFNCLICGDRSGARQLVDELLDADCTARKVMTHLFWPTLEQVQHLHRNDQLSRISHHYATRLLRQLQDQMQLRLERAESRNQTVLVTCGDEDSEELAAQLTADLLEADGYTVFYAGGGIANDELVAQINNIAVDKLVVFGVIPATVPQTRMLIDRLHAIGACTKLQVVVGGGVFNRADGLAEEIGADLWGKDPEQIVEVMDEFPDRRMTDDQRTVGRKRRTAKADANKSRQTAAA